MGTSGSAVGAAGEVVHRPPVPQDVAVRASRERDPFIDFVRAFSLLVVVAWHWCFTLIVWRDDGPHATNPIGFTDGLWTATWLLQVMPLFFFVGGFSNLVAWRAKEANGLSIGSFVWSRVKQLAVPSLALAGTWIALGTVVALRYDARWIGNAVKLVISPLWFIAAYLVIIALFPIFEWLHDRFDVVVVVVLVGCAWLVDVARFRHGWNDFAMVNMILVWGACHQLGFFYERMVAAHRRVAWSLTFGGLFALSALVYSDRYPGSMVGVPGDKFSNMAPPTMAIVALVFFQSGIAVLVRGWVVHRLQTRERWARVNRVVNRFSMPLFLFHSTGMAIAFWLGRRMGFYSKRQPDFRWWLFRPVSFVMPLLFTLPVIYLFGRRWIKGSSSQRVTPT